MNDDFTIQLRGLNEATYCEKLFYLMYARGIFYESADTIEGNMNHKKRERQSKNDELEGEKISGIILYGMDGKLSGKLDGVIKQGNDYIPIEDKNSKEPGTDGCYNLWNFKICTSAWLNDFPQIVGQMYLLRKNNYPCNYGRIYYRGSNSYVDIPYLEEYDQLIENGVSRCLNILQGEEPEPLIDSEKCIRCSLHWACLPDEVNLIKKQLAEPRRLYPGRTDQSILYVTTIGSKVGKTGECLTIYTPNQMKTDIAIKDIEHICVFGNIQVTTQAMEVIIRNGGSVFYFSSGGWLTAMTHAPVTKNIYMRMAQFSRFKEVHFQTNLIKKIVSAKIANQRTLLRRNRKKDISDVLNDMKIFKEKVSQTDDIDSLRGYEGNAAMKYWKTFPFLFKNQEKWEMNGRNRRPPKDEINAMLSFGYTLLLRDFITAILETGLDHMYGFYHAIVPGRPALALDMMEPYRPIIVDSMVLRMINEEIVKPEGFARTSAGVFMSPETKRRMIYMYEMRMDEMITHPVFGYRLSYRRMIHLETKLLGKYIYGEIDDYTPLMTR